MGTYEANKKWRLSHPAKRTAGNKRYHARFQGRPNTRKPWTDAEIARVLAHEVPDRQLAEELQRSVQAIHSIRHKMTH